MKLKCQTKLLGKAIRVIPSFHLLEKKRLLFEKGWIQ